jgi:peptidoglycan hydrolase-like protein with peptidoglycan-binding domain
VDIVVSGARDSASNLVATTTTADLIDVDTEAPSTPTADAAAGTYTANQSVVISSASSSAIRYTTDGTTPSCSVGTAYASAITVSTSQTIKAVGCDASGNSSAEASFAYTINTAAPASGGTPLIFITNNTPTPVSTTPASDTVNPNNNPGSPTATPGTNQNSLTPIRSIASEVKKAIPAFNQFVRSLGLGSSGTDVKALQMILANYTNLYPEKIVSGVFGSLTRRAVQRFQELRGIAKPGNPGYGLVGPQTKASLNSLLNKAKPTVAGQKLSVSPTSNTVVKPITKQMATPATNQLTQTLGLGSRSAEVKTLQTILSNYTNLYPEKIVSGPFGPLTVRAVQRFQKLHGIAKPGDTGYGLVGPQTREQLNKLVK